MQNLHTLRLKGSYQFQCHLVARASKYGAVRISPRMCTMKVGKCW